MDMNITQLKTNHITQPLGYDYPQPVLSWQVEDTRSAKQLWARVEISLSEAFDVLLHDSGERADIDSIAYTPDITLLPMSRYHWRVTVMGDGGDSAQAASWFETAKMEQPWLAKWITPDWEDKALHPCLRKRFVLEGAVKRARLYICGLGAYVCEINGRRVGDEYLAPGFIAFDCWTQYQTYDVTAHLEAGDNAIGALLGNGWAKGRFGQSEEGVYTNRFALIAELHVEYEDGKGAVICTDESWRAAPSPVVWSQIYDGEFYDANRAIPGWSTAYADSDNTGWSAVRLHTPGTGPLVARMSLPLKVKKTFKPVQVLTSPGGGVIVDAGQNFSGWLRMKVDAPKGAEIILSHGEILQDGELYQGNLGTARQEYRYVSDGTPAVVEPHFTYYGFRYVKVEGWPGDVNPDDFEACAVYSDLDETGHIETSDSRVNRLIANAVWGQRSNFTDTPTDCPQRSERMGWTGDAQVFCGTASFNMDTAAFYAKYMRDVYAEQLNPNTGTGTGCVPNIVPNMIERTPGRDAGACAWADCATIIPWTLYEYYGDKTLLRRQFPGMCAWVDWVERQGVDVKNGGGWLTQMHFGDWLALDNTRNPDSYAGGTENAFLAAAYYRYSTALVAKAARVLGEDALAEKYEGISARVRREMAAEYYSANGRATMGNQTYYLVSLFMDIVPGEHRGRLMTQLARQMEDDRVHLKTGFIGTPILCRVLSDNGRSDLAYQLLLNDDYPSWLYEVDMGATTIWERWNSVLPDGRINSINMNSLNHYAYGSILEWMYRNMCGLNQAAPGFRRATLKPEPNKHFRYAKADYRSAAGLYSLGWEIVPDNTLVFTVTVPFGAWADLFLPDCSLENLVCADELESTQEGARVKIGLPAGTYRFTYIPDKPYIPMPLGLESPIKAVVKSKQALQALEDIGVHIPGMVLDGDLDAPFGSLRDLPFAHFVFKDVDWDAVDKRLKTIFA